MAEVTIQPERQIIQPRHEITGIRSGVLTKANRMIDTVSAGKDRITSLINNGKRNVGKGTVGVGLSVMLAACGGGEPSTPTSLPITTFASQELSTPIPTATTMPSVEIPSAHETAQPTIIITAGELERTSGAIIKAPPRLSTSPYYSETNSLMTELDKMDKSKLEIVKTANGTFAVYKINAAMIERFPFDLLHITLNSDGGRKGGDDGNTINYEFDLSREEVVSLLNAENPYKSSDKEPVDGGKQTLTIVLGHQSPVEGAKNFFQVPENFIMPDAGEPISGVMRSNSGDPWLQADFNSLAINYYPRDNGNAFGSIENSGDEVFTTTYSVGAFYAAGETQ